MKRLRMKCIFHLFEHLSAVDIGHHHQLFICVYARSAGQIQNNAYFFCVTNLVINGIKLTELNMKRIAYQVATNFVM